MASDGSSLALVRLAWFNSFVWGRTLRFKDALANKELKLGDLESRTTNGMSRARTRHGVMEAVKLAEQWGLDKPVYLE